MPAKSGQYYRTEQEIAKLFQTAGLPMSFTNHFTRDYAAVKGDIAVNDETLTGIIASVDLLDIRVGNTESSISSLNSSVSSLNTTVTNLSLQTADIDARLVIAEGEIGVIEVDLLALTVDFNAHESANSAHGASGDIVGVNDFCTLSTGGTVLLASALAASPTSTLAVVATPNAAGISYDQADAATWVSAINELKSDFNALITEYNALVSKVNGIISTQVSSNQRAP